MREGLASVLADCSEHRIQPTQVSQEREALTEAQSGRLSGKLDQVLPEQSARIGIMVLSSACKLLYANQPAYEFLTRLNRMETGHATSGALPKSVAGLFDQMRLSLASRMMQGEGEQLQASRVFAGPDQTVLLQAFGLLAQGVMQGSRVVMTMQVVSKSFHQPAGGAMTLFV